MPRRYFQPMTKFHVCKRSTFFELHRHSHKHFSCTLSTTYGIIILSKTFPTRSIFRQPFFVTLLHWNDQHCSLQAMSTPQEQAVAFKNDGNKAFAAHDWPKAIESYTKAIELDDTVAAYFSNRAQVRTTL